MGRRTVGKSNRDRGQPFCSGQLSMGAKDSFTLLNTILDGQPLIANINVGLRQSNARQEHSWLLSISIPLANPTTEGLPTKPEAEDLNRFEDAIEERIASAASFVFVGRVTWSGHRELLYYVDRPEQVAACLQRIIDSRSTRPFAFRCEEDSEWSKISVYMP